MFTERFSKYFDFFYISFHSRMWSLKKFNLTTATRRIRQSLLQPDGSVNSPQAKNFNALGVTTLAHSSTQVIVRNHDTN